MVGQHQATLQNRKNIALLVIDVQNSVVENAHHREAVINNIPELVEKAQQERVPVNWVQHSGEQLIRGSGDWQIVSELTPDHTFDQNKEDDLAVASSSVNNHTRDTRFHVRLNFTEAFMCPPYLRARRLQKDLACYSAYPSRSGRANTL